MSYTVTFDDRINGFTSFHSFIPEAMVGLRGNFFSVKNGQLYKHNDRSVPRNNFYGVQYASKVTTVINESPSDDKIFKTLVLEGNGPWSANVRTNLEAGTITFEEFNQRESRYFTHLRKSETGTRGHTIHGIGSISAVSGSNVTLPNVPDSLKVGDFLYQLNGSIKERIGEITVVNGLVVSLGNIVTPPVVGRFCFLQKNNRIEGAEMRGYYLEVELETYTTESVELFDVSSNAVKSYL